MGEEYVAGYLAFWGLIWITSMFVAHAIGKPKNRAGFLSGTGSPSSSFLGTRTSFRLRR